jgi:hypothetical protein
MEEKLTLKEFQKKQAIDCFNKTWDLIDKSDRTDEETLEMIHCAHASRFLWGQVGEPLHFERGEWQISKVYYLTGNGERALYHGLKCLEVCEENNIKDFDITFAYEAVANAYKLLNNADKLNEYKKFAYDSLEGIEDKGNKDYAESELNKI